MTAYFCCNSSNSWSSLNSNPTSNNLGTIIGIIVRSAIIDSPFPVIYRKGRIIWTTWKKENFFSQHLSSWLQSICKVNGKNLIKRKEKKKKVIDATTSFSFSSCFFFCSVGLLKIINCHLVASLFKRKEKTYLVYSFDTQRIVYTLAKN